MGTLIAMTFYSTQIFILAGESLHTEPQVSPVMLGAVALYPLNNVT